MIDLLVSSLGALIVFVYRAIAAMAAVLIAMALMGFDSNIEEFMAPGGGVYHEANMNQSFWGPDANRRGVVVPRLSTRAALVSMIFS